jgi:hypothetical protein
MGLGMIRVASLISLVNAVTAMTMTFAARLSLRDTSEHD